MKKLKTRKSQIAYAVSSILALASTTLYAADGEEVSGDKEAERVIVTGSLVPVHHKSRPHPALNF